MTSKKLLKTRDPHATQAKRSEVLRAGSRLPIKNIRNSPRFVICNQ